MDPRVNPSVMGNNPLSLVIDTNQVECVKLLLLDSRVSTENLSYIQREWLKRDEEIVKVLEWKKKQEKQLGE